mmetsp:Transcript_7811/g.35491  ORF Transcript_7811/g.35491 Transcript_7811/m.35491 type:complete len:204 (+) Transcript_7811:214-825(+)
MPASRDYYAVLGVDRNANDDQLKKAYRKMAVSGTPTRTRTTRRRPRPSSRRSARRTMFSRTRTNEPSTTSTARPVSREDLPRPTRRRAAGCPERRTCPGSRAAGCPVRSRVSAKAALGPTCSPSNSLLKTPNRSSSPCLEAAEGSTLAVTTTRWEEVSPGWEGSAVWAPWAAREAQFPRRDRRPRSTDWLSPSRTSMRVVARN